MRFASPSRSHHQSGVGRNHNAVRFERPLPADELGPGPPAGGIAKNESHVGKIGVRKSRLYEARDRFDAESRCTQVAPVPIDDAEPMIVENMNIEGRQHPMLQDGIEQPAIAFCNAKVAGHVVWVRLNRRERDLAEFALRNGFRDVHATGTVELTADAVKEISPTFAKMRRGRDGELRQRVRPASTGTHRTP